LHGPLILLIYTFRIFSFGLCGRQVCSERINTYVLDDIKAQITAALENITKDMLQHIWQEVDCRWDIFRATDGSHCGVVFT
jgi:hypothetical protein